MKDFLRSTNVQATAETGNTAMLPSKKMDLTATQQYLLQLQKSNPLCAALNEGVVVQLDSATDLERMQHAFTGLMQVNPLLATSYHETDGTYFGMSIPCVPDFMICGVTQSDSETLTATVNAEYNTAFDLSVSCMRIRLYQLKDMAPVMLVMIHPIACGGWSPGLLAKELLRLYEEHTTTIQTPELWHLQYAQKEAAYLNSDEALKAPDFWNPSLSAGATGVQTSFQSNTALAINCRGELKIPVNYDKVAAIARQAGNNTTIFDALLSVYQYTVASYTGQQPVFIGTERLSRLSETGGYFVQPRAIPGYFNQHCTFQEQIQYNKAFLNECKKYAHYPLAITNKGVSGNNGGMEYFSYFFSMAKKLHDLPAERLKSTDTTALRYTILDILKKTDTRYKLHLMVLDQKPAIDAVFHYNTSLINEKDIQLIGTHFSAMLDALADNSSITTHQLLSLQTAANKLDEKTAAFDSKTSGGYSAQFTCQAKKRGNAPAVTDCGGQWSYAELDEQSNNVCANLISYFDAAQIKTTDSNIVAVAIERGRELTALAIGIWKAGCTYMPVDPSLPSSLIEYMLEDAGARLFITSNIIPDLGVSQVLATPFFNRYKKSSTLRLPVTGCNADGAYIMYTSEQSGGLNGCIISQEGMLQHIRCKTSELHLDENSRVAQTASQSCDVSVWQMFAPLLCGAQVLYFSNNQLQDADKFITALRNGAVTVAQLMPVLVAAFAEAVETKSPPLSTLRWLVTAGEEQSDSHHFRWLRKYPHIRLINCYGPVLDDANKVTIGKKHHIARYPQLPVCKAMANMQLFMVDEYGRLNTPGDAADELWEGIVDYLDAETASEEIASGNETDNSAQPPLLAVFSSCSMDRLKMYIGAVAKFIEENESLSFADLCYTLGRERVHYGCRKSFVANSNKGLLIQMNDYLARHEESRELNTPVNPVLLFSDAEALSYNTVEYWCRSDANFKEIYRHYLERITVGMERTAPSIFRFVFQIAYYDYLKHHGIAATRIAGVESGQITAAVTENIITLEEGASKIKFGKNTMVSTDDMAATVEKLIAIHTRSQKPVFIDMGLNSWITGALERHPMNGSSYFLFDRTIQSPAQTVALLQSMLYDNNIENPFRFFDSLVGQSVELPFRKFTQQQWKDEEP